MYINQALLFGSRAKGINQAESDWDFAIWFENKSDVMLRFYAYWKKKIYVNN